MGESIDTPPAITPEPALQPAVAIVVDEPAKAAEEAAAVIDAETSPSSVRGVLRLLVASGVGKAGVALFVGMVLISIWVLATYPSNYGRVRWSSPAVWADNPKNAPPAWTNWLGGRREVVHTVVTGAEPSETRAIAAGEIRTYRFPLAFASDRAPTSLALTLNGVTFYGRPPAILATLIRTAARSAWPASRSAVPDPARRRPFGGTTIVRNALSSPTSRRRPRPWPVSMPSIIRTSPAPLTSRPSFPPRSSADRPRTAPVGSSPSRATTPSRSKRSSPTRATRSPDSR
jgi:hypothetical protein